MGRTSKPRQQETKASRGATSRRDAARGQASTAQDAPVVGPAFGLGHRRATATATTAAVRSRSVRDPTQLGALVRAQRQAQGLTQIEVAEYAGVGPRFLGELERGKPTLHLGKVLAVLGILGLTVIIDDIDPVALLDEGER